MIITLNLNDMKGPPSKFHILFLIDLVVKEVTLEDSINILDDSEDIFISDSEEEDQGDYKCKESQIRERERNCK